MQDGAPPYWCLLVYKPHEYNSYIYPKPENSATYISTERYLGGPSRAEGEEDSGFHRKLSQENQSNSLIPSPFQFASHHFELKDIPKNDRNAIHCQELEQGFPRFSIVRSNELPYFHYFPISGNQTWPSSTDNYRYIIDTSMKSQIFLYPLVIWHIAIEHGHRNSW